MTIIVDDAGSGDLLFGMIISAYRKETGEFIYDVVDVEYFNPSNFRRKVFLKVASRITLRLIEKMKPREGEPIQICRGYVFNLAVKELKKIYGEDRVETVRVGGMAQLYSETAYLDELRNIGYEPLKVREEKWAKNFYHMLRWLERNPARLKYAKTGWPRLIRYRLFRSLLKGKFKF